MTSFESALARGTRLLIAGEQRLGLRGLALVLAIALVVFAGLYASENFVPLGFGATYARLATEPFRFDQPDTLQYRILTPLVAHYLGLRGNLFPIFTHGASVLFLATLYVAARRRDWSPLEAAGLAAALATSANVLTEIHFPGLTDPVSYLLLLWALLTRARPALSGLCLTLALLNHESNFFALPWLLAAGLAANRTPGRRFAVLLTSAAAVAIFAVARALLQRQMPAADSTVLTPDAYLGWSSVVANLQRVLPYAWLGIFSAYKLLWILPVAVIARGWRTTARPHCLWMALVVACALAQLVFAEDSTRLMAQAFPAILCSAALLREQLGPPQFARRLWLLIGLSLLVPTVTVFGPRVVPLYPLPVTIIVQLLFGLPL